MLGTQTINGCHIVLKVTDYRPVSQTHQGFLEDEQHVLIIIVSVEHSLTSGTYLDIQEVEWMSSQNRSGQNYNSIKVQKGYLFFIYSSDQSQALCMFSTAACTLK